MAASIRTWKMQAWARRRVCLELDSTTPHRPLPTAAWSASADASPSNQRSLFDLARRPKNRRVLLLDCQNRRNCQDCQKLENRPRKHGYGRKEFCRRFARMNADQILVFRKFTQAMLRIR